MNRIIITTLIIFASINSAAQTRTLLLKQNMITQLVFESSIKSIKTAIPDTLHIDYEDNNVYITPLAEFQSSNINIVTEQGDYYSYILKYSISADSFNFFFTRDDAIFKARKSKDEDMKGEKKGTQFNTQFTNISAKNGYLISNNATRLKDITLILKGVYVTSNHTYLQLEVDNSSNIDYNIEALSFYVRARDQSKTITNDQLQLYPLAKLAYETIPLKQNKGLIFVFDKFTINNEKVLCIDLIENHGERNLSLPINSNIISKAKTL